MKSIIEIQEKKFINDSLYLKIKKARDIEIALCSFLNALKLDVEPFDRAYEDVINEYIYSSNRDFKADLIASENCIHLIIHFKIDKRKEIDAALKEHF